MEIAYQRSVKGASYRSVAFFFSLSACFRQKLRILFTFGKKDWIVEQLRLQIFSPDFLYLVPACFRDYPQVTLFSQNNRVLLLFEFYWIFHQIYVVMEFNVLVGDLYCLYMRINSDLNISQCLLYFYPKHAYRRSDAEQLLSCQLQKWQSGFAQSRHRAGVAHYFWELITKTMVIHLVKSHKSVFFHLVWKYLTLIELWKYRTLKWFEFEFFFLTTSLK